MTNAKSFIPCGRDGSAQMVIGEGMDSFLSGSPSKTEQQKNLAGETQRSVDSRRDADVARQDWKTSEKEV